jgi:hypothetical protein
MTLKAMQVKNDDDVDDDDSGANEDRKDLGDG